MTPVNLKTYLLPATASAIVVALSGCAAAISTTNTAADAAHTVTHGVSVSSRGTTNISSGEAAETPDAQTRAYMQSQMPQIRREAAAGGGEHIDALARLISHDTQADSAATLGPWMQSHYSQLFTDNSSVDAMIVDLKARRN